VTIDGAGREIVLIREFSQQINLEKKLLKQREDNEHTQIIHDEITTKFT